MDQITQKYNVISEFKVHWGDMDAAQHVNNLVYLKWSESGRIEYFDKMGISTEFGISESGPILGWQDCKYIFPVTYPDTVLVGTRTIEVLSDRFLVESRIYSKKHKRLAAITTQRIVPYDYKRLRKIELPNAWIEAIERVDKLNDNIS